MQIEQPDDPEKIACPGCKKLFFRKGLDKHMDAKHPEAWACRQKELDKPVCCEICNFEVAQRDHRKHLNQEHSFGMFLKKKGKPYIKSRVAQKCLSCGGLKEGTFVYGTNPNNAKHICAKCRKIVFKYTSNYRDALDFAVFSSFETSRKRH
jgi:hypothetical protein